MNYDPRYVYLYPASIPQIVAHIQEYLRDNPITSTATITQLIINELSEHPEILNGAEIPITAEDQQSIKDYIDHLPSVDGYTKEQVNALLDEKQDVLTFDQAPTPNSSNPVTSSGISTAITTAIATLSALINLKANLSDVYTKSVIDQLLAAKANAANVYTKTETDTLLNDKADETEVTDLKSALNGQPKIFSFANTASVSRQFKYDFYAGNRYAVTNNTTAVITFQTRETKDESTIDNVGYLTVGATVEFVCSSDAHWFNSWSPQPGSIEITLLATAYLLKTKTDVLSVINSIENIEPDAITGKLGFMLYNAWNGNVGSTAHLISSPYRVSNTIPALLKPGKYAITIASGYRISYRTLNASNVIQADSGWKTASFEITIGDDGYYYAFTGGKSGDAAVTLEEFLQNVSINFISNLVETVNGLTAKTASKEDQIVATANVKAVNHRGYNSVAPENTLPAFKLSKQNGFRYVETDVRFTSDNVPVLLHDTTINRTARNADGTEISDTINIANITYEQASAYDFGIWKGASYAGTKIPTLAEFMNLCRNIGLIPRVELNVLTVANAQTMFDVINSYGMARKVEYNCNNIAVAQKFLELEPSATIVYGMSSYNAETVTSIGALKTANNTIIINMYYTAVSAELIAQCKQYGIELEIWVTDSESVIKNLDPFISGVSSNRVNASVVLYNSEMN